MSLPESDSRQSILLVDDDEVFVQQIGPDQEGFLDFYQREILPAVAAPLTGARTA